MRSRTSYCADIESRVFANVGQTQANQISDASTLGFGYLKGVCKCEYAETLRLGAELRRANTRKRTGTADILMIPRTIYGASRRDKFLPPPINRQITNQ